MEHFTRTCRLAVFGLVPGGWACYTARMAFSENPMTGLLQLRARRNRTSVRGMVPLCLGMSLSSLLLVGCGQMELACYYAVQLSLTLLLVPYFLGTWNSGFLLGLRRGGCIDEVLGTCTPARALVDGVVGYTLRDVFFSGLLLLGPLDAIGMQLVHLPGGPELALLWPVLLLTSTMVWGYFIQLVPAWAAPGESLFTLDAIPAVCMVMGAGLGSVLATGTALCTLDTASPSVYWARSGAILVFGLAVTGVLARGLGLLGLACSTRVRAALAPARERLKSRSSGRNHSFYRRFVTNPVAWREFSRSGGLSEFLSQHSTGLLGLALLFSIGPGFLPWLVLFNLVRTALASVDMVARERENRTMDSVVQSGLSSSEFLKGVLCAAALPRVAELTLLTLVAVHLRQTNLFWGVSQVVVAVVAPIGGAAVGLYAAEAKTTRRECHTQLLAAMLCWCLFFLVMNVAEQIYLPTLIGLVQIGFPALLLLSARSTLRRRHRFST
jgi:hypothetical protein